MIRRSMAAYLVAAIVVAGAALTSESVRAEGGVHLASIPSVVRVLVGVLLCLVVQLLRTLDPKQP